MNKHLFSLLMASFVLSQAAQAQLPQMNSIFADAGDVYYGEEWVNFHPTGKTCSVTLHRVQPLATGVHCYTIDYSLKFASLNRSTKAKAFSTVTTPETSVVQSCAQPLVPGSADITDTNGALLYTPVFTGGIQKGMGGIWGSTDYVLTFSPGSKRPNHALMTVTKTLSEMVYECENLHQ